MIVLDNGSVLRYENKNEKSSFIDYLVIDSLNTFINNTNRTFYVVSEVSRSDESNSIVADKDKERSFVYTYANPSARKLYKLAYLNPLMPNLFALSYLEKYMHKFKVEYNPSPYNETSRAFTAVCKPDELQVKRGVEFGFSWKDQNCPPYFVSSELINSNPRDRLDDVKKYKLKVLLT